jgi:Family of unknown function (DUF6166)
MEQLPDVNRMIPFAFEERFYSTGLNGRVTVREADGKRPLDERTDLYDYSITLEWGRDSAGAAQLSLALLADALGNDDRARLLHESFRRRVVVDLPERWTLTRSRIVAHARMLERNSNWPRW